MVAGTTGIAMAYYSHSSRILPCCGHTVGVHKLQKEIEELVFEPAPISKNACSFFLDETDLEDPSFPPKLKQEMVDALANAKKRVSELHTEKSTTEAKVMRIMRTIKVLNLEYPKEMVVPQEAELHRYILEREMAASDQFVHELVNKSEEEKSQIQQKLAQTVLNIQSIKVIISSFIKQLSAFDITSNAWFEPDCKQFIQELEKDLEKHIKSQRSTYLNSPLPTYDLVKNKPK